MGAAVGKSGILQDDYRVGNRISTIPVLVKLTPNVSNIQLPARAAKAAGADGISLSILSTVSSELILIHSN